VSAEGNRFKAIQTATGWKKALERFVEWIDPPTGWRTLDLGCGPGLLPALLKMRGCRAFGLDLEHLGADRLHPHLVQGDATRLPFPEGAFDLLTASNLLFLLPQPQAVLAEMRRLLAPGGQVAVLNPSERLSIAAAQEVVEARQLEGAGRESLLDWAWRAEAHARWSQTELEKLLSQAGLRLVEASYQVGSGFALAGRAVAAGRGWDGNPNH